jgi:hypothetical protein
MIWIVGGVIAVALVFLVLRRSAPEPVRGVNGRVAKNKVKAASRKPASRSAISSTPRGPYAAVSIKPGMVSACDGALESGNKRYLLREAPTLPLAGCDQQHCGCRLVHHDDRRSDDADDRRIGIGLQSQLFGASGEADKRSRRRGRRSTD